MRTNDKEKTEQERAEQDKAEQDKDKAEREQREKADAAGNPIINRDRIVDPGLVIVQNTYRVGFLPPQRDTLTLGELYIELGEGAPKLWVGIQNTADLSSNIANIEMRIEQGIPGAERFEKDVDRGPAVLVGGGGTPRDPPLPATPADALPITQQNLAKQYQDHDQDTPVLGQEGVDQRAAYETPHPAHRDQRDQREQREREQRSQRAAQPQDHKPEQK